jgi:hypothetical protein
MRFVGLSVRVPVRPDAERKKAASRHRGCRHSQSRRRALAPIYVGTASPMDVRCISRRRGMW